MFRCSCRIRGSDGSAAGAICDKCGSILLVLRDEFVLVLGGGLGPNHSVGGRRVGHCCHQFREGERCGGRPEHVSIEDW